MSEKENVVFLAYRTDKANIEGLEVLACARCRNKAWTVAFDSREDRFPRLVCTACATDGGSIGWFRPDEV